MKEPIRIFSDLHLGHPACLIKDIEKLRPLLEGAGTAIFNGDTWQELSRAMENTSARMLQQLKDLCAELEVTPIFLPGNHDPSISETNYLELNDGEIVIFHGQTIFPEVSPWSNYYFDKKNEVQALLKEKLFPQLTIDERFSLAKEVVQLMTPKKWIPRKSRLHYYLSMTWPPKRLWMLIRVKKIGIQQSVKFINQYFPKAKVVIIGHFHKAFCYSERGKFQIINTGAFMRGCKIQYVEFENESFITIKVKNNSVM